MLTKTFLNSLYGILFSRMILDGIAGIQFILQGKFSHFAFLKPYLFILYFQVLTKKNFQKKYYNIKSIVYQYYINSGKSLR
jgi:hypothetical protein